MMTVDDAVIQTSGRDLDRALAVRYPVVLVFDDPDSSSGRSLELLLEELGREYADRIRVIRVTEQALDERTALRYGVFWLPTLLFRRHGVEVARVVGQLSAEDLRAHVEFLLGNRSRPPRSEGPSVHLQKSRMAARFATSAPDGDAGAPLDANDASFGDVVLQSAQPVLVDFWAGWCRPCRAIAPEIDELAHTYAGRLRVVKVDTDAAPGSASRYRILSIPTLMLFRDGRPVYRATGAVPKESLRQAIDAALSLP